MRRLPAILSVVAGLALASGGAAAAFETSARQAYLVDHATGAVLFAKNADAPMFPASMSKMMTVYLVFEQLRDGRLELDDLLPVSEKAWRKGGSKMYVEVGRRVRVEDLLRGIIVQSGNDASIVVAEALAGSEDAFAARMTAKAREMGLAATSFRNATGWPHPEHVTTARDLATLARRTIDDFPDLYRYYSEKTFTFNGIKQGTRNPLLYADGFGADGLKTGHTQASGYGLAASVVRDGRRLILVVNGMTSARERAREAEKLVNWGFREFENYTLFKAGELVDRAEVWLGGAPTVGLVLPEDLTITLPRRARARMSVKIVYEGPVPAPVAGGAEVARLIVVAPDVAPVERPLFAAEPVRRLDFFGRIGSAVRYLVWGAGG